MGILATGGDAHSRFLARVRSYGTIRPVSVPG